MRSKFIILSGLLLAFGLFNPIQATSPADITIPVSTVIRDKANTEHLLSNVAVDNELVGLVCAVQARGENQSSVHPGNDLVIASGSSQVVLEDVERASNVVTNASGDLTLGSNITVSLLMGQDGVFSGGMDVTFTCAEPEPEQIEVCRDGKVITIDEDERLDTDTNAPCPEQPKQIEVCRDGKMITIDEDERRNTDTDACVLAEKDLPETLPNTGPGAAIASFLGASSLFAGIRSWIDSKRNLKSAVLSQ